MASKKNLKKDINYVIGDIIEATYLTEMANGGKPTAATDAIVEEAISTFDELIHRVNIRKVEDKKAHFTQINKDLESKALGLIEKINSL